MEERLENWKFAQFCPKTTICSGWTEIALIDIWKRWPHREEELMNWWDLVWSSARSAAHQGWKTRRWSLRTEELINHMWSTKILFGDQAKTEQKRIWYGSLTVAAPPGGRNIHIACLSVQEPKFLPSFWIWYFKLRAWYGECSKKAGNLKR